MLALAAANAVGVVLFGTLYLVAGTRLLSQAAFVPCLLLLFVLMIVLWIRTEARHRSLTLLRRLGRVVVGLAGVVVLTPALVLTPLFWLDDQLPSEAGLHAVRGGIMAVVLIALGLVALVNVAGVLIVTAAAALGRGPRVE